mmetsp:Transcript_17426/g.43857  ORF Transcript_17426/g.43857 Transcript_17426/m.43857 type:complete len:264 (+) Transcript_17426:428-1219(+)
MCAPAGRTRMLCWQPPCSRQKGRRFHHGSWTLPAGWSTIRLRSASQRSSCSTRTQAASTPLTCQACSRRQMTLTRGCGWPGAQVTGSCCSYRSHRLSRSCCGTRMAARMLCQGKWPSLTQQKTASPWTLWVTGLLCLRTCSACPSMQQARCGCMMMAGMQASPAHSDASTPASTHPILSMRTARQTGGTWVMSAASSASTWLRCCRAGMAQTCTSWLPGARCCAHTRSSCARAGRGSGRSRSAGSSAGLQHQAAAAALEAVAG